MLCGGFALDLPACLDRAGFRQDFVPEKVNSCVRGWTNFGFC